MNYLVKIKTYCSAMNEMDKDHFIILNAKQYGMSLVWFVNLF